MYLSLVSENSALITWHAVKRTWWKRSSPQMSGVSVNGCVNTDRVPNRNSRQSSGINGTGVKADSTY